MHGVESGRLSGRELIAGVSLGLAVPGLAFGKAIMAPFLLFALMAMIPFYLVTENRRVLWDRIRSPIGLALCVAVVLWLVSGVVVNVEWHSFATVTRTVGMILLGLLISVFLDANSRIRDVAGRSLIWSGAAILLFIVLCIYAGDRIAGFVDAVGGSGWSSAQDRFKMYGSAAVCLLPVMIYFGFRLGGVTKWVALLYVPLDALQLYADGVQPVYSGLLGLIGSLVFVAVVLLLGRLSVGLRRVVTVLMIVAVLGGGYTFLEALPKTPVYEEPTKSTPFPDLHRQLIWSFAWDVLKGSPWFGVGPNMVSEAPGAHAIIPGLNQEYIPAHPHSWFLEIGSETGFLGLTAFSVALLLFVRRYSVKVIAGSSAGWAALFLMGIFWSSALVNFSIWAAWWGMTIVLLQSILPWAERSEQIDPEGPAGILP